MSALGQKQTCAAQYGMSALPLKADIIECNQLGEVGSLFLPVAPRCASKPPINEDKMPGSSSRRNGIGLHMPIVTRPSRAMRCAAYMDSARQGLNRKRT
jgi:hypothetical protein